MSWASRNPLFFLSWGRGGDQREDTKAKRRDSDACTPNSEEGFRVRSTQRVAVNVNVCLFLVVRRTTRKREGKKRRNVLFVISCPHAFCLASLVTCSSFLLPQASKLTVFSSKRDSGVGNANNPSSATAMVEKLHAWLSPTASFHTS
ncbi:hypothetical protein MUK42_33291 [Musa troglodytarum]|uniref:Transmembrane protein n=1 Tax=Musa troglodytarum TaxID=320322 RepID=A0A9E7F8I6_9LILI|nr:hypothetical protein MUK42_33291 [Musa troglodytarum]